jgi:hypothetical protein
MDTQSELVNLMGVRQLAGPRHVRESNSEKNREDVGCKGVGSILLTYGSL